MTTTAPRADRPQTMDAWRGFVAGPWQDGDRRPRLHPAQLHPVRPATPRFLAGPTDAHHGDLGAARPRCSRRSASAASTTSTRTRPSHDHRARARLHRQGQRADRRPADRRPAQARDHAQRRLADGRGRRSRPTATSSTRPSRRSSPSTARPTTTACSTPTRRRSAPRAASHIITGLPDAYGRGRIIGDYRRVAALRRGRADRGQEARPRRAGPCTLVQRGRDPRPRGERRADPRPAASSRRWPRPTASTSPGPPRTAREAVQWLYFAYLGAVKEQNGAAMSLGRTSTFLDVYLAARPRRGRAHRERGAGAGRRLRHQAADRAVPAHPGVRRAVLRRPDLGHRVDRRDGRGRPHRWSPARRSGSCRPSTTWARRRSRT